MLRSNRLSATGQVPLAYCVRRPAFSARFQGNPARIYTCHLHKAGDVVVEMKAPLSHQNVRDSLRVSDNSLGPERLVHIPCRFRILIGGDQERRRVAGLVDDPAQSNPVEAYSMLL